MCLCEWVCRATWTKVLWFSLIWILQKGQCSSSLCFPGDITIICTVFALQGLKNSWSVRCWLVRKSVHNSMGCLLGHRSTVRDPIQSFYSHKVWAVFYKVDELVLYHSLQKSFPSSLHIQTSRTTIGKKTPTWSCVSFLEFAKRHLKDSQTIRKKILWFSLLPLFPHYMDGFCTPSWCTCHMS